MSGELIGNPYVVGPPVTGESLYGRQDVFQFIHESLAAPSNRLIVLHGQRRVGKSSVLQELHLHRLPVNQYRAIRIDVQGQAQTPFNSFAHDLATHITEALKITAPNLLSFEDDPNYLVQTFLPFALSQLDSHRLVIMIDEFDALTQEENGTSDPDPDPDSVSARILPTLQTILGDNKFNQIVFILVIGSSLEKLPKVFKEFIRGARFNRIWLLSKTDAETLITQPAAGKLSYMPEAIERIWFYTSGHPYFTQLLCYELFNRAKRRQQPHNQERPLITANDVDQIINAALERGRPAFVWLWDALSVAERLLVSAIGSAAFETGLARREEVQKILNHNRIRLGNVNLIEAANHLVTEHVLQFADQDGYRFEVELVREWVRQNHNLNQEKLKISEMSRSAISYYNVARRSHDRDRLDAAIEAYRLALQDNPNHFNAQLGLAEALSAQGNLEEAVDEFEDAYWLNQEASLEGLVKARLALATHLEAAGQVIEAAVHYRRVHELAPDFRPLCEKLKILYDKGEQARSREQWSVAVEFFSRVVDIDPQYGDAHQRLLEILYNQGQTAERAGEWFKATQFYRQVQEIDPAYKDIAERYNITERKTSVDVPQAAPNRRYGSFAVLAIVLVVLVGLGGWFIWGGNAVDGATPTLTVTASVTDTPTLLPTDESIIEAVRSPIAMPTTELSPIPTKEPSTEPISSPTAIPKITPFVKETLESTTELTTEPTAEPTTESTMEPTGEEPTTEPPEEPASEPTTESITTPQPLPIGEALDIDLVSGTIDKLFALLKDGSIHRTLDGGNAWVEVVAANSFGFNVLEIAASNPNVIYVGGFGQVYKSVDSGAHWKTLPLPGPVQVYDLAIAASNAEIVYAASDSGILISQNGGDNWYNGNGPTGTSLQTAFYAVAVTTGSDALVYAAGEGDVIYRTDNPGANWQPFTCSGCTNAFYALAAQGNIVYAGGAQAALFRSDNGGFDWQLANSGIPNPTVPQLDISQIALSPNNTVYASTGFRANNANGLGLFYSKNSGGSWTLLPLPPEADGTYHIQSVVVDPDKPDVIYIAGFGGVHKSEDGGQTWMKQ